MRGHGCPRGPRHWVRLTPWLLLLLLPVPALAGDVRGTVWLSRRAARAGATSTSAQPGAGDCVVWVEQIPEKLEQRLAAPPRRWFWQEPRPQPLVRIEQRRERFVPQVTAVALGSQIEFANRDRIYHNAFSVSAARRFDLGKYAPGRVDTLDFLKPGVINVHCDIHPTEGLGYIVVTPNHAFTRPDANGRFELPRLPAGHYIAHAWHPRRGEIQAGFDVPRRGAADVQLRY